MPTSHTPAPSVPFRRLLLLVIVLLQSAVLLFAAGGENGTASPAAAATTTANVTANVSGRIIDAGTGAALPGATVQVQGSDRGVATNRLGLFRLEALAPGTYVLEGRFLGYSTNSVSVTVSPAGELQLPQGSSRLTLALEPTALDLSTVQVFPPSGPVDQHVLSAVDGELRPSDSGHDLLRLVPGLTLAQHAGGGKAEQLFLRGFDLDHGTDIRINVDGMPVNMVSHAHGQGYADAHFIIPETVEALVYETGIGGAEKGNFSTAGSVDYRLLPALDKSIVQVEAGSFNTYRAVALIDVLGQKAEAAGHSAYVGGSFRFADGPFAPPQGLKRYNGIARYRYQGDRGAVFELTGMGFQSSWSQAGLLAPRAVEQGLVDRFGTLDSAEQGTTDRYTVQGRYTVPIGARNDALRIMAYGTRYSFDLISNFTYFLENPVRGDRIRQTEERWMSGGEVGLDLQREVFGRTAETGLAMGLRHDNINNLALSFIGREPVSEAVADDVMRGSGREANVWAYASQVIRPAEGLRLEAGVRADLFWMAYTDALLNDQTTRTEKVLVSPRLRAEWAPVRQWTLFAEGGQGFHSNDLRVLIDGPDTDPVAPAWGVDLGTKVKAGERVLLQATAWWLRSSAELVYVGDGGIVEPGDASRRLGVDLSARAELPGNLHADADVSVVKARTIDAPEGENLIPLAPWLTSTGGLQYRHPKGFQAAVRYRYLADRAADETGAFTAEGYALLDASVRYEQSRFAVWVRGQNLTNVEWKEAQFLTTSRLFDETEPVDEVHFTPGFPLGVQAGVALRW